MVLFLFSVTSSYEKCLLRHSIIDILLSKILLDWYFPWAFFLGLQLLPVWWPVGEQLFLSIFTRHTFFSKPKFAGQRSTEGSVHFPTTINLLIGHFCDPFPLALSSLPGMVSYMPPCCVFTGQMPNIILCSGFIFKHFVGYHYLQQLLFYLPWHLITAGSLIHRFTHLFKCVTCLFPLLLPKWSDSVCREGGTR